MVVRGLDISIIQGNVDFVAVAASGIQFIIARCGVGNSGIDVDYAKNIINAKAAGLYTMAYHFVYPLPTTAAQPSRDPVKQAQAHFTAAQGTLAAMDLEWPTQPDWQKWGCSASQINDWGLAYLEAYSNLSGKPMIIYTYPNFAQTVKLSSDYAKYPLWIASYQATPFIPAPWTSYCLWQTTGGGGKLPNGAPVDTDVAPDLSLWVPPTAPPMIFPPNPTPVTIPSAVAVPPPAPAPIITTPSGNILTNLWGTISKFF
jgi:lysozyme